MFSNSLSLVVLLNLDGRAGWVNEPRAQVNTDSCVSLIWSIYSQQNGTTHSSETKENMCNFYSLLLLYQQPVSH